MAKGLIGVRHLDWMEFVWTNDLPSNAKLIAAYLSSYMNKHQDHAFPSLKTIEGETGLGHATVLKYLEKLESSQFLIRKQGGGRNNVTYYHVRFPEHVDEVIKQVNSRPLLDGNRSAGEGKQVGSCSKTGREPTTNQQLINKDNHKDYNSENLPVSPRCPTTEIVNLFHERLSSLPQCKKITSARASSIKQRHFEDMDSNLEVWADYFDYIKQSPWLMGQIDPKNGRRVFRATLDWICKAENFAKIYEGKYHE